MKFDLPYSFRYLVTPISGNQTSLLHELNKSKEELMIDLFNSIDTDIKTVWTKRSKRYIFYGFQKKGSLYIIKFAKESKENIYVEGEMDIEVKDIEERNKICISDN